MGADTGRVGDKLLLCTHCFICKLQFPSSNNRFLLVLGAFA